MFEQLVEWAGTKVAQATIRGGWFLVRQMRKDAANLASRGRSDASSAIHKAADEMALKLCNAEVELGSCST